MDELFTCFHAFLGGIVALDLFIYVVASMTVCAVCGLITYFFRSGS